MVYVSPGPGFELIGVKKKKFLIKLKVKTAKLGYTFYKLSRENRS